MPRKQRCRWIGGYPEYWRFSPEDAEESKPVVLTLDEFETIRLLDKEGLTQEQCAQQMGIARTTVTAIYDSARKKLAQVIVDGRRMEISGGHYQLVQNQDAATTQKGMNTMRIAVTYEDGQIFQHFGHTEKFKIYDVQDGQIVKEEIVDTNGQGHGALAGFLKLRQVDALICGGIGGGARMALSEAGIHLYGGAQGDADAAVKALIAGALHYDPNAECNHPHHGGGHSCGRGHHDGSHACGHSNG